LGINDQGNPFEVSPDPNYESLSASLSGISLGQTGPFHSKLKPILSNPAFFGVNLYDIGLGERVEELFTQMLAAPGSVREVLNRIVTSR
jgi:fructuronate reductase